VTDFTNGAVRRDGAAPELTIVHIMQPRHGNIDFPLIKVPIFIMDFLQQRRECIGFTDYSCGLSQVFIHYIKS